MVRVAGKLGPNNQSILTYIVGEKDKSKDTIPVMCCLEK